MEMLTSIMNWMIFKIRQIISMNDETANIRQKPLQTIRYYITDKKHFKGITIMTFLFIKWNNNLYFYALSLNREVTLWFQYDRKAIDENGKLN